MKIDEITGYHEHPAYQQATTLFKGINKSMPGIWSKRATALTIFMDFLATHGFKKLGKGEFGLAFEKPGYHWVFKIFTTDSAYLSYVKYAMANQSNPNVPKFKGGLIKINDHTFAIRIEKLIDIEHRDGGSQIMIDARKLGNLNLRGESPEWLKDKYPGIYDIIQHFRSTPGVTLDLHMGNVMMRGNDTLVIVDPVYDPQAI
jgi:hypothetical protein